jgi:hypothetical protein
MLPLARCSALLAPWAAVGRPGRGKVGRGVGMPVRPEVARHALMQMVPMGQGTPRLTQTPPAIAARAPAWSIHARPALGMRTQPHLAWPDPTPVTPLRPVP